MNIKYFSYSAKLERSYEVRGCVFNVQARSPTAEHDQKCICKTCFRLFRFIYFILLVFAVHRFLFPSCLLYLTFCSSPWLLFSCLRSIQCVFILSFLFNASWARALDIYFSFPVLSRQLYVYRNILRIVSWYILKTKVLNEMYAVQKQRTKFNHIFMINICEKNL